MFFSPLLASLLVLSAAVVHDTDATLFPVTGPVSVRCHPTPETPGNSIGLEAIIRKALMGKYDDQSEDRSASCAANPMGSSMSALTVADGRAEDFFSQGAIYEQMLYNLFFVMLHEQQMCVEITEMSRNLVQGS